MFLTATATGSQSALLTADSRILFDAPNKWKGSSDQISVVDAVPRGIGNRRVLVVILDVKVE